MHELPRELASSLRSWRSSTYGNGQPQNKWTPDIEKAELESSDSAEGDRLRFKKETDGYGDDVFERAMNNSSMILHPTASRHGLNESVRSSDQDHDDYNQIQVIPANSDPRSQKPAHYQSTQFSRPPRHPIASKPSKPLFNGPRIEDPDPAADRLDDDMSPLTKADFYELMGMRAPVSKNQNPKDLSTRHGLYGRIHYDLEYTQTKYRIYDVLVYVFLMVQLFLSAVFIVLGSLTRVDSHIAIAVLGAVSTVIAGTLALMKGQGLPNRLRQTRDSLRNVVFEAEELYWDVGADRSVYYKDIKKIREDYLRVLEESRRNHPDTWNATATKIAQQKPGATTAVKNVNVPMKVKA